MSRRLDDALLSEVRDRTDIVRLVGEYVALQKAGTHHKALCPFHNEKTPSFTVHEDRQFFYCFGCQTGGDAISFVREMHGFSFVEAVRHLAERAGLDTGVTEPTPRAGPAPRPSKRPASDAGERRQPRAEPAEREAYYAVGDAAQRFFTEMLDTAEGEACRRYLETRGLDRELAERYGLGFAPDRWESLLQHLQRQGHGVELAESAGLAKRRKSGRGHYDAFRNRLVFPIRNLAGKVIAFGGRSLRSEDDEAAKRTPKYINSPDTLVYSKRDWLYGLYEARPALRERDEAVVVEGNVDVLRVAGAGFPHVVAPMGTALTEAQCARLRRFVSRILLLYDGDDAGRAAARKAIPVALGEGLQVAVAQLPEGEDPDSFIATHGGERLGARLQEATPGWEFLVDSVLEETRAREDPIGGTPRAVDQLAPVLEAIDDRRRRELCRQHLAGALGLEDATLRDFLRDAVRRRGVRQSPGEGAPDALSADRRGEEPPEHEWRLLQAMLMQPDCRLLYQAQDARRLVSSTAVRDALEQLAGEEAATDGDEPAGFVASLEDGPLKSRLSRALVETPDETDWIGMFQQHLLELRLRDLDRRKRAIDRELQRADRSDEDAEQVRMKLLRRKIRLEREVEELRKRRNQPTTA